MGRVVVVGCEVERIEEEMGLSEPVSQAVAIAVGLVRGLVAQEARSQ